ncbi:thiomuracin/GE37468 family thiazolyl RiPP peptide [Amycolatopsis lurida]
MSVSEQLDFELEKVPMDVFDLADSGLTVESLTGGHGMTELGGSACCACSVSVSCSCCSS